MKKQFYMLNVILFAALFVLDISTKLFIKIGNIQTDGHLLDFTFVTNIGSLFGLFHGYAFVNVIFILLSIVALVGLFFFWKKEVKFYKQIIFISAGIMGNLFDRIVHGFVVDWINFHFWPVFNIADSLIVVGVIWMITALMLDEKK